MPNTKKSKKATIKGSCSAKKGKTAVASKKKYDVAISSSESEGEEGDFDDGDESDDGDDDEGTGDDGDGGES